MIPLYTQIDFDNANYKDKLKCQCNQCKNAFSITKHEITRALNPKSASVAKFCSQYCAHLHTSREVSVICKNCNKQFNKKNGELTRSPNSFCSRSCSATYNNKNKTKGIRRSKLEKYLEGVLTILYPNLEIHFNKKDTINSELDIYIPSLKLAFELNGFLHYKPIYGIERFKSIKKNDSEKKKKCIELGINFHIIKTIDKGKFTDKIGMKYLRRIQKIIPEYC